MNTFSNIMTSFALPVTTTIFSSSSSSVSSSSSSSAAATSSRTIEIMFDLDTLQAMRRQEQSVYRPVRFWVDSFQHDVVNLDQWIIEARSKMVEWCFKFVDVLQLQRSTVAIAMNCFDRFLTTTTEGQRALLDPSLFQLFCVAALYTTIKTQESKAVAPKYFANLGGYSEKDIEQAERLLLNALNWRVHPPMPLAFCQEIMSNLLPELPTEHANAILELAKFQTELAVFDSKFSAVLASSIAVAATVNAMESVLMDAKICAFYTDRIQSILHVNPMFLQILQNKLYESVANRQHDNTITLEPATGSPYISSSTVSNKLLNSPRCVSTAGMIMTVNSS